MRREVKKAKVPILLIHGMQILLCHMCDEIHEIVRHKKVIIKGAAHMESYYKIWKPMKIV